MSKNKKKLTAQILAIILTVLMVTSLAFYAVYAIVGDIKAKKEADKKEESKTAEIAPATEYFVA